MTKGLFRLIHTALLTLLLCECGNGSKTDENKMSEMEQLKYNNTVEKLEAIHAEATEAAASGNATAQSRIYEQIERLKYDFNPNNMGKNAQQKCKALKELIETLKKNPESVFPNAEAATADAFLKAQQPQGSAGTLVRKRNIKLPAPQRFPYSLKANDKVLVNIDCQGTVKASFYDIHRQKCIRQWNVDRPMSDSITISESGIYMIELTAINAGAEANLTLAYTGTDPSPRRRVREKTVGCRKGDFLATPMDSIIVKSVFREPKKVGLRGNLKAMFSGKSRAIISVPIPSGCDALLYSLRISTNEKTVSSDGKFAQDLSTKSFRMKLFGHNVFEGSIGSGLITNLLGDTRPPREEDAFCNMYVLTDAAQAKKFQDETDGSGNYKYDVNQSQIGTQSCNGQLHPNGQKTLYLGFENERMRYDNYIWIEVVALTYTHKYVRPVYIAG